MAEPTEADRAKAARLVDDWDLSEKEGYARLAEHIAAALADERERARATACCNRSTCVLMMQVREYVIDDSDLILDDEETGQ